MKIILSRKGFDAGYGGCASPIFEDGTLLSLPIPIPWANRTYGELNTAFGQLGELVRDLTGGRVGPSSRTHLDPDLSIHTCERISGWKPAFGQNGAALSHLERNGVGVGDLFLFFGWFREVKKTSNGWKFTLGSQNIHAIFGWLQIGEVLTVGREVKSYREQYPWLSKHPHLFEEEGLPNNTIYVASPSLDIPGMPHLRQLPGGGTFQSHDSSRVLTDSCQNNRSLWKVPEWFLSPLGHPRLSYHGAAHRWSFRGDGWVNLQTVRRGQEFVLPLLGDAAEYEWLSNLFKSRL